MSLFYLVALLAVVVALNWRFLQSRYGRGGSPCAWSRVAARDRDGRRAWFCPSCRREVLMDSRARPPDCGLR